MGSLIIKKLGNWYFVLYCVDIIDILLNRCLSISDIICKNWLGRDYYFFSCNIIDIQKFATLDPQKTTAPQHTVRNGLDLDNEGCHYLCYILID